MTDVHTPEQRRRNMQAIRAKNTGPELYLRKLLFGRGFRYRIAPSSIPGRPDIYLPRYSAAIFVHGCYWHRHAGCRYATTPQTNQEKWIRKFESNKERDRKVLCELQGQGIRCAVIWECAVRRMKKDDVYRDRAMDRLEEFLKSDKTFLEIPKPSGAESQNVRDNRAGQAHDAEEI